MTFREWVATLPGSGGLVHAVPGDIAEIIIDHPPTRNALDPRMMVQFADAVAAVAGARVILLRGAAGSFCSGGNLEAVREHLVAEGAGWTLQAFMRSATDALAEGDAVVIGVLEGAALGGGAELLTCCDEVHASPTARVGFIQAALGVSPGFGGGARLIQRVGPRWALRLLTTPAPLDAPAALDARVVDHVVDDPLASARARAAQLLAYPPAALRGVVQLIRAARDGMDTLTAAEADIFARLWGGPEHVAALAAAQARRRP